MNRKIVQGLGAMLALLAAQKSFATNGDILEGIGAVSEALGGTGVAAPQDGLSAIVNNPAGLSCAPDAAKRSVTLGVNLLQPAAKAKIATPAGTLSGGSHDPLFEIPSFSYSQPINDQWNFGLGVYGAGGLGLDYRGQHWDLDGNPANGYEGDLYTRYSSLKVAPALSYKVTDNFSLGAALQGNYNTLSLGQGQREDMGLGAELGALYKIGTVQLGLSYTTPQKFTFNDIYSFEAYRGDPTQDSLSLVQPATYAGGIAWLPNDAFMVEFNAKYLTWGRSEGYDDFDWKNEWVFAIGTQYKATRKLALRAGFNYGENPVIEHNGWNPQGITTLQGKPLPTAAYELERTVGLDTILQSHLTLGFGYQLTDALTLNAVYSHAFKETLTTLSAGNAISFESTVAADLFGISFAWVF